MRRPPLRPTERAAHGNIPISLRLSGFYARQVLAPSGSRVVEARAEDAAPRACPLQRLSLQPQAPADDAKVVDFVTARNGAGGVPSGQAESTFRLVVVSRAPEQGVRDVATSGWFSDRWHDRPSRPSGSTTARVACRGG